MGLPAMVLAILLLQDGAREREIRGWVERLGSDQIAERDEAEGRLAALAREFAARVTGPSSLVQDILRDLLPPSNRLFGGEWGSPADPTEEDHEILRRMRTTRLRVDHGKAGFLDAVDFLRERSGLNIHIRDPASACDAVVDLSAVDLTIETMLHRMLAPLKMVYTVEDGVVIIRSLEEERRRVKLELYDIQDLEGAEGIALDVVRNVHPALWEESEGKSIGLQNGLLIVRQCREVHQGIRAYLASRRRTREVESSSPVPLVHDVRAALEAVLRAAASGDAELRARAGNLAARFREAIRPAGPEDPLRSAIRESREAWRWTDAGDFEACVRKAFGDRAIAAIRVTEETAATPEGVSVLQGGKWVVPGDDAALDPDPEGLIFALPRPAGHDLWVLGPECVELRFAR